MKNHWHLIIHGKEYNFMSKSNLVDFFDILDLCLYDPDLAWKDSGRLETIRMYFEDFQEKKKLPDRNKVKKA